ncbi:HEAT repeat domain-containing protein [Clostridiaceae bacterium 35-E11]
MNLPDKLRKDYDPCAVSWKEIDKLSEPLITYLLYKEGKSIQLIAKIRRMSVEQVNQQLIRAKTQSFAPKIQSKSILERMLEVTKTDRQIMLANMSQKEKNVLGKEIYRKYSLMTNPEDKMVIIWIIGELGIKELLPFIYKDAKHPHGNVRRLVCSAMNKIGDSNSIPYLHRALLDIKPQVRQYAAKALSKLGDQNSIVKLGELLKKPYEKEYVKRAYQEAILNIERRLEKC